MWNFPCVCSQVNCTVKLTLKVRLKLILSLVFELKGVEVRLPTEILDRQIELEHKQMTIGNIEGKADFNGTSLKNGTLPGLCGFAHSHDSHI